MRDGDWKLLVDERREGAGLFDVRRDAGESKDAAAADPARTAAMREKLEAMRRAVEAGR